MKVKEFFRAVELAYREGALTCRESAGGSEDLLKKADELEEKGRSRQKAFNFYFILLAAVLFFSSFLGSFLGELGARFF